MNISIKDHMKWFLSITILILLVTISFSKPREIEKQIDYFKLSIQGRIFQPVQVKSADETQVAVIDKDEKFVSDRFVLEKVFRAGQIIGFFPEPAQRKLRFANFESRIANKKRDFKTAFGLIPIMEFLSKWAFDLGPRSVAEALKIAATGGASYFASSVQISKEVAKEALRDFVKNPHAIVLATICSILQDSIASLEEIEKKINDNKNNDILDFADIQRLEQMYWEAAANGTAATRMYQTLSGDPLSNLLHGLQNGIEQLIKEVDYSKGQITTVFFAKQFQKIIEVDKLSMIYLQEKKIYLAFQLAENQDLHFRKSIDQAERIAQLYDRIASSTDVDWKGKWVVLLSCPGAGRGHSECEAEAQYNWLNSLPFNFSKFKAYYEFVYERSNTEVAIYDIVDRRRNDIFLYSYGAFAGPFSSEELAQFKKSIEPYIHNIDYFLDRYKIRDRGVLESEERLTGSVQIARGILKEYGFGNASSSLTLRTEDGNDISFEFESGGEELINGTGKMFEIQYQKTIFKSGGKIMQERTRVLRIARLSR